MYIIIYIRISKHIYIHTYISKYIYDDEHPSHFNVCLYMDI